VRRLLLLQTLCRPWDCCRGRTQRSCRCQLVITLSANFSLALLLSVLVAFSSVLSSSL
jgi:hypothetical protein